MPPLQRPLDAPEGQGRWIVAPDGNEPWLPGSSTLLWACVRAARDVPRDSEPAEPLPAAPLPAPVPLHR
ncbi:hypothetical protein [Streptacidiphilus pinicola]|uniref:hypothetical protein n=1 Tax=Streptacidiphilus pinicola TaxID=2219663 RepID=UPI00269786C6